MSNIPNPAPARTPKVVNHGMTIAKLKIDHDVWDLIPESNPPERKVITHPMVVIDCSDWGQEETTEES